MAGKIIPNTGKTTNRTSLGGRLKGAASGLFGFVFWLIVASVFPYAVLTPYWPAAGQWAPLALYVIAFLNLIKAVFHLGHLARLAAQAPSLRTSMRQIQATIGKAERPSGKLHGSKAGGKPRTGLPPVKSTPTVQRMR